MSSASVNRRRRDEKGGASSKQSQNKSSKSHRLNSMKIGSSTTKQTLIGASQQVAAILLQLSYTLALLNCLTATTLAANAALIDEEASSEPLLGAHYKHRQQHEPEIPSKAALPSAGANLVDGSSVSTEHRLELESRSGQPQVLSITNNAGQSEQQTITSNNNNNSSILQEVIELSALEAAKRGYFRHSTLISVILTVAYSMVFVIGIIGNSFVVAIVYKSPRMRTVTNYFIANLAFADILVLLFCLPATLMGNLFIPYVLGLLVCKTVSYLQGVAVSASINTMVTVTLDRFLAIYFPMYWHMSRRTARWIIACIWIFSACISAPWAIFFTLVPYPLEQITIQVCAEDWPSERWDTLYFVCANLILLYLLPATVIIICYLGIWYKIECRKIPGDRPKSVNIELIIQRSKLKVVKMMMVVVVIFLLSWLPLYLIFARIKLFAERSQLEDSLITNLMPLAQWLGASNSCINPILYTFFNRKYKRGLADLLRFAFCCGPSKSEASRALPAGAPGAGQQLDGSGRAGATTLTTSGARRAERNHCERRNHWRHHHHGGGGGGGGGSTPSARLTSSRAYLAAKPRGARKPAGGGAAAPPICMQTLSNSTQAGFSLSATSSAVTWSAKTSQLGCEGGGNGHGAATTSRRRRASTEADDDDEDPAVRLALLALQDAKLQCAGGVGGNGQKDEQGDDDDDDDDDDGQKQRERQERDNQIGKQPLDSAARAASFSLATGTNTTNSTDVNCTTTTTTNSGATGGSGDRSTLSSKFGSLSRQRQQEGHRRRSSNLCGAGGGQAASSARDQTTAKHSSLDRARASSVQFGAQEVARTLEACGTGGRSAEAASGSAGGCCRRPSAATSVELVSNGRDGNRAPCPLVDTARGSSCIELARGGCAACLSRARHAPKRRDSRGNRKSTTATGADSEAAPRKADRRNKERGPTTAAAAATGASQTCDNKLLAKQRRRPRSENKLTSSGGGGNHCVADNLGQLRAWALTKARLTSHGSSRYEDQEAQGEQVEEGEATSLCSSFNSDACATIGAQLFNCTSDAGDRQREEPGDDGATQRRDRAEAQHKLEQAGDEDEEEEEDDDDGNLLFGSADELEHELELQLELKRELELGLEQEAYQLKALRSIAASGSNIANLAMHRLATTTSAELSAPRRLPSPPASGVPVITGARNFDAKHQKQQQQQQGCRRAAAPKRATSAAPADAVGNDSADQMSQQQQQHKRARHRCRRHRSARR